MCYAKLMLIMAKNPGKTCINKFYKTYYFCANYQKLQTLFFALGFAQQHARPLKAKLCSLKYKWEFKGNNIQTYIVHHKTIFQHMNYLKVDGYFGINAGMCVWHFLAGINKSSLETPVQTCKSQCINSTNFEASSSYFDSMVQKPLPQRG